MKKDNIGFIFQLEGDGLISETSIKEWMVAAIQLECSKDTSPFVSSYIGENITSITNMVKSCVALEENIEAIKNEIGYKEDSLSIFLLKVYDSDIVYHEINGDENNERYYNTFDTFFNEIYDLMCEIRTVTSRIVMLYMTFSPNMSPQEVDKLTRLMSASDSLGKDLESTAYLIHYMNSHEW